jgi:putative phosphoribosyl transferase
MFADLSDAGRRLADLVDGSSLDDPLVLALARGGVPLAEQVARRLDAPLDVLVVRKVGHPAQHELGIGAVVEGSEDVVVGEVAEQLGIEPERVRGLAGAELEEVERRVRLYRGERPLRDVRDRDLVLVDDGVATGVTAEAALRALRSRGARKLVLAVGVAASDTAERLAALADEVVCVLATDDLGAVGAWYDDFTMPTDDEVRAVLAHGAGQ